MKFANILVFLAGTFAFSNAYGDERLAKMALTWKTDIAAFESQFCSPSSETCAGAWGTNYGYNRSTVNAFVCPGFEKQARAKLPRRWTGPASGESFIVKVVPSAENARRSYVRCPEQNAGGKVKRKRAQSPAQDEIQVSELQNFSGE